ncbi:MAG TPA: hypothetical protein VEQ35_07240 [Beijerinckia sp.]|jgi:uncharacterized coiled-coil protein SlyX|nr:hypothetical protein [Beijerinckia sp.]
MSDEPMNLVLEHLGHIRAAVDRTEQRLDDLTLRVGHIERAVAEHSVQMAELNGRMDRFDARLARVERRLELVEG